MKTLNLEWLACPVTKEKLTLRGNTLVSSAGSYSCAKGYWNLLPQLPTELSSPQWQIWQQLQANGVAAYTHAPNDNLGVGPRNDFLQFCEFCNFDGLILDVGVGPQKIPTHIEHCHNEHAYFLGIDPLEGVQPRAFSYIQAIGEYLPFQSAIFDQVLFVTTLDHFIQPSLALAEAMRVLKKDGSIFIWLGEKLKTAPKPKLSSEWYRSLTIPEGADDPFHYKRLTLIDLKILLAKLGLVINHDQTHTIDEWRSNHFLRIVPSTR